MSSKTLIIGGGSVIGRNENNKHSLSDDEAPEGISKVSRTQIESEQVSSLKDKLNSSKNSIDLLLSNSKGKLHNESLTKIIGMVFESFASVVECVDHVTRDISDLKGNMGGVKVTLEENRNRVNETLLDGLKNKMAKEIKENDLNRKKTMDIY